MRMLLLIVALALPSVADAQKVKRRKVDFYEDGTKLSISVSLSDLFTAKTYKTLSSGMVITVRVRVLIVDHKTGKGVALALATMQAVYDLWNERFEIRSSTQKGVAKTTVKGQAEALRAITELNRLPVAKLTGLRRGHLYRASIVAELNPISNEQIAEIRQWIQRPASSGETSSVFGSFVASFVSTSVAEADAVLKLRSQPFFRPRIRKQ